MTWWQRARAVAAGALLTAVPLGLAAGAGWLGAPAVRSATSSTATAADLVTAACALACAVVLLWLAAAVAATTVAALRAGPRRSGQPTGTDTALVPAVVQRLVATAVGLAIGAGASAAHAASPAAEPGWAGTAVAAPADVTGTAPTVPGTAAPVPARLPPPASPAWPPLASAPGSAPPGAQRPAAIGGTVVVHRGDTLWSLVSAHLRATDGQERATGATRTAAEVQRWWAANRDVIGPDPDLLHPGQVLHVPPAR
ncbi:LysM domain-containing protein [Kineococcus glutinatus]|uniref:LysM domain-containing protein n=1 Tax=Kineococcus glutinatus TaxID=1070872 RepID=A0ABP9HIJ1_9ACTN